MTVSIRQTATTAAAAVIALFTVAASASAAAKASEHHVLWSGDVDDRIEVLFHKREAKVHRVSGKGVDHEQAFFRSALPEKRVAVHVRVLEGRGDVEVFQQPSSSNKWTAGVRIDDPKGGRGHYRIEVSWR